jgi:hypothetical protein
MWYTISDMNPNPSPDRLQAEIREIQKILLELGPIHPGSISMQYQVCGKPGCRCQHPTKPKRHGPYGKLFYVHRGSKVCRFVRADCLESLRARVARYKTFRKLIDRWIELSIEMAKIEFFKPSVRHPR